VQTLEAQFKSLTDTCIAYANEAAQLRAHAARYALGLDLEACDSLDCMCVRRRYESLLNTKFEETRALALDDRRRIDEATRKADTKFGQYDQQVMPRPPRLRRPRWVQSVVRSLLVVRSSSTTAHAHRIAHRLLVDPPAAAALPSHIWRTGRSAS
jgi:hypothetical protein